MLFDIFKNPFLLACLYQQAAENFIDSAILKSRNNSETARLVIKEVRVLEEMGITPRTKQIETHAIERILSLQPITSDLLNAHNCIKMSRQLHQPGKK